MSHASLTQENLQAYLSSLKARVGICASHLPSQRQFLMREKESFPLASTFKVPLAVHCLALADTKQIDLDEAYCIQASDLRPGGELDKQRNIVGKAFSLRDLLGKMLEYSDNTASDILYSKTGGPAAVTRRLRSLGFSKTRIDRNVEALLYEQGGVPSEQRSSALDLSQRKKIDAEVPPDQKEAAARQFLRDARDSTTPEEFAKLLKAIWNGDLLSEASRKLLLDHMRKCRTGLNRIRKLLPRHAIVADKTGSASYLANNVGIIESIHHPGEALILAIFLSDSELPLKERERVIAEVSLGLFELFFKVG